MQLTIDDVRRLLRECAGDIDGVDLFSADEDTPLDELGYDSLARLELTTKVQRESRVRIPDSAVFEMTTLKVTTEVLNSLLGSRPAASA